MEYLIHLGYETHFKDKLYIDYVKWRKYCAKIVLKASAEEIEKLSNKEESFVVYDAGLTQIEEGSLTVVGFLPCEENRDVAVGFKLL